MTYILNVKNNKYHLEIKEKINGVNNSKRSNNQVYILNKISRLGSPIDKIIKVGNDYRITLSNDVRIILKDYDKHQKRDLYSYIMEGVSEKTEIIDGVIKLNLKKLKRMVLTGLTFITLTASGAALASSGDNNSVDEIVYETQIQEPTLTKTPTNTPIPSNTPTPTITPAPTSTPIPTVTPTPTAIPTAEDRMVETLELVNSNNNSEFIPVGTKLTEYSFKMMKNHMESEKWLMYLKYGSDFGFDPYLMAAISYRETNFLHDRTIPGGKSYNGFGVGEFQHETPDKYSRDITAFNYNTGEYETVKLNMESACDLEMNIKMGAMILQNRLHKYNNNIYITIQSYNYGTTAMDMILEKYANELGCTKEDVINNKSDFGWMEYVCDFHEHPQEYLSNWKYKTYGNENYLYDVLGYYIGTESMNMLPDGTIEITDMLTMDVKHEVKKH